MDENQQIQSLLETLSGLYAPVGFEIYPFKIGWYNDVVEGPFKFDLDPDTLAFIIISTPDMFSKAVVPFMCHEACVGTEDILDTCMRHYFKLAKELFPEQEVETMHDFELLPTRRPKILVQPAAHVAGAAYYYTRRALDPDPFDAKKKVCGVSVHPVYGGWFAIRGVIIFRSVRCPKLSQREPPDAVPDQAKRAELLTLFNDHWRDWRFRDIIQPQQRYDEDQRRYFDTEPKNRKTLVRELKQKFLQDLETKKISKESSEPS